MPPLHALDRTWPTISNGTTMSSSASTTDSHPSENVSQHAKVPAESGNNPHLMSNADYAIYEKVFLVGIFAWTFGQLLYRLISEAPR